jgi:protein TonB
VSYRPTLGARDRTGAIVAVVAVHAALLLALLHLAGKMPVPGAEDVLKVFNLAEPPPPPEISPPPQKMQARETAKPKEKEGAAAPKNLKSEATPVKQQTPRIALPLPVPVAASPTPAAGTQPTQGTSTPGPGTGAGGTGNGSGSGAGGNGTGGGGAGGAVSPPHLATPVLRDRDFPRPLLEQWPRQTTAFLRLRVDSRGYVGECTVDRGTGVAAIDAALCNLAHDRLRFRPALDRNGEPVAGWFGYAQPAPR